VTEQEGERDPSRERGFSMTHDTTAMSEERAELRNQLHRLAQGALG
jgi:hypothetical protein